MRVLLFRNVNSALRFLRRHGDKVVQVVVVVRGGRDSPAWKGAVKSNYGAQVLSGLILLEG